MKNSIIFILVSILLIHLTFSCKNATKEEKSERPGDTWVFRSVLDENPRMISIALHDNLWTAYSTETGGLYKAWQGGINFDGPVYTSAHGPQPTTMGITFMQEPVQNPWQITMGNQNVVPEVDYKGHIIKDNDIILKYDLLFNGKVIHITEQPDYFSAGGKKVGFERVFTLSDIPEDAEVLLNLNLGSLQSENDIETNGSLTVVNRIEQSVQNTNYLNIQGTLLLNKNATTTLSVKFTPRPEIPVEAKQASDEEAVLALFAKSDCNTCHNIDVRTVGPAYIDIAKKYPNTREVRENLVQKIIEGGAGNWGDIPMTPHPDLANEDAVAMVEYILSLDGEDEETEIEAINPIMPDTEFEISFEPLDPDNININEERPGIAINLYQYMSSLSGFPEDVDKTRPVASGVVNAIHFDNGDFGPYESNFVVHATGFINLKEKTNLVFRLVSDDGSRLYINDQLIIDHGGFHAMDPKDGEMNLDAGKHAFRIEYFQAGGGRGLSLQWHPHDSQEFKVIPPDVFTFKGSDIKKIQESPIAAKKRELAPGDTRPLEAVHPSFDLAQARPDDFNPKVGGMDFLSDGRMVVSTWDSLGSVFILDGVQGKDPAAIKVKRIAYGLAEPLGLRVVDNEIYVMQKQELTKLIDHNNDDIIDEYQTVANGWKVSANFHEFAFGLLYKDGYFYGTLATAINPGGASTQPQIPDRGKVVKISKEDGSVEFIASGLRTPNGIGYGVDNEIFIADNQGDWLPASKIVHLQEGQWYGSRSVDFEGTANKTEKLPVVWLPQDEIGNSPSQPAPLNVGPYKNQMIHGEVTHGGIKRVFAEKVEGEYQGAVFRFTQGLEAGVNRLIWGPDGALYIGGVGSTGNWGHIGKLKYGLQKITFNNNSTFEMLAVRAKSDGVEIKFTEPLKAGVGLKAADYEVRQWFYKPTEEYGGPKLNDQRLNITAINISDDRRRVFLKLSGMKTQHMIYLRLSYKNIKSEKDQSLWSTEAWYNMNKIPKTSGLATR